MKEKKNVKKKLITAVLCIILLLGILSLIFVLTRSEAEKTVASCRDAYWPYWKVKTITEDNDKQYIYIEFCRRETSANERKYSMKETYDAIVDVFFEDEESPYHDYTIDIMFVSFKDQKFGLQNMTADMQNLTIYERLNPIQLEIVALYFPDACVLDVDMVFYKDIHEIEGFSDLKHIDFGYNLPKNDKNYILSVFPDCVIEDWKIN